jgi:hypothetical protein
MTSRWLAVLGVGLAMLAAGCSKDGPTAGDLVVTLNTPNSDDGAIMFAATAPASETITGVSSPCGGCKLFLEKVSATQYKGVVTGTIPAGALFRVSVSDNNNPTDYSVQILAVSSQTSVLRNTSGYSVTLTK